MGFNFDPQNFGLGFGAGLATGYAIYRARNALQALRQTVQQGATSAQSYATESGDRRYSRELAQRCERRHLLGPSIPLSQIIIEPRFVRSSDLAAVPDEDEPSSVFDIVPRVPDHPYLYASYHLPTVGIADFGRGERLIALLGGAGSGRTIALQAIALWSLGKLDFPTPPDPVAQRIAEEEEALSVEERAERIRDMALLEAQVTEKLVEEGGELVGASIPPLRRLVPLLAHLADVRLEAGVTVDPAEPLVRALQFGAGRITARTLPRHVYDLLSKGNALILLDGYDELPKEERLLKIAWLRALADMYGRNTIIVTGPASGYGDLTQIGFAPLFVSPWSTIQISDAARLWAERWGLISGKRREHVSSKTIEQLIAGARGLSPAEITLLMWSHYANPDDAVPNLGRAFDEYVERIVATTKIPQSVLVTLAARQLDEGLIRADRLDDPAGTPPKPTFDKEKDEEDEEVAAFFAQNGAGDDSPQPTKGRHSKFIDKLVKAGVLQAHREGYYRLSEAVLAAYLGSLWLKSGALSAKLTNPRWEMALAYANLHRDMSSAVEQRLATHNDLLLNALLLTSRWLAYCNSKPEWRNALLRQLGNAFIAPMQYPLIRERIACALVGTRDEGAVVIFSKALRSPVSDVRKLAALGLGALGHGEAAGALAQLLEDEELDVQIAAGMALVALGTPEALAYAQEALAQGTERLRQAIAESLAASREVGYSILYEASNDSETMMRRAAVLGLSRVPTNWALVTINRLYLSDPQWYVRSAAQQALQDLRAGVGALVRAYPTPEAVPWLIHWANSLGEALPQDADSGQLLELALQDNDSLYRSLAALTIGQLGLYRAIAPLYGALYDPEEVVRDAAFRGLADLQLQIGRPLPLPA